MRGDAAKSHFDTAGSLNLLMAVGGTPVIALAAVLCGDPSAVLAMTAFAAALFVAGIESIGIFNFGRDLVFSTEFRFVAAKRVATFVVAKVSAFVFRLYWAFVLGKTTGRIIGMVPSYRVHRLRQHFTLILSKQPFAAHGWPQRVLPHSIALTPLHAQFQENKMVTSFSVHPASVARSR